MSQCAYSGVRCACVDAILARFKGRRAVTARLTAEREAAHYLDSVSTRVGGIDGGVPPRPRSVC
jgi:hypothetical protein